MGALGRKRRGVGQARKLRGLRLWKDGQAWVGFHLRSALMNSKGHGFSSCLLARGKVLAPTIQITLAVNVGARGHNPGARRFQRPSLRAQIRLEVRSAGEFRGWAWMSGMLTSGPRV